MSLNSQTTALNHLSEYANRDLEGVVCRVQGLLPVCHSPRIVGFNNTDERRVRMSHFAASEVM